MNETVEAGGLSFRKALTLNSDGCCSDCTKKHLLAVFRAK
jgi:hypothetical protein